MKVSRRLCLLASVAAVPGIRLARAARTSVSADTATGKVRGYSSSGVLIFRGVPYGGPTEGSARFLPPTKPAKWTSEKDCTANGPRCVQGPANIFRDSVLGEYFGGGRPDRIQLSTQTDSENCLNLSVLTPSLRGKRPVMVYIHGGGFAQGSGVLTVFGDRHVREQDVVLIGVNHRINVFGYTYLGGLSEKFAVGNPGQLDLFAALEWVRDNVSHFGGDPSNVTIFGESGGGGKISALMAMPAAKGLFHKAIIESGSELSVGTAESGTARTKTLLARLGLSKAEDLQNVPAAELYKTASAPGGGEGPVIDGHSIPQQTWEPSAPEISSTVPKIIGSCKDETALFTLQNTSLYSLDNAGMREALVKGGVPEGKVASLIALYRRDYPKDSPSDLYFRRPRRDQRIATYGLQLVWDFLSLEIPGWQELFLRVRTMPRELLAGVDIAALEPITFPTAHWPPARSSEYYRHSFKESVKSLNRSSPAFRRPYRVPPESYRHSPWNKPPPACR
jgi:para-nitrobenzyl esterase